ncbi:xylulose kinase [Peptidiphaga gingivicola]|uniref:Xylulose kinase n=2 Tax=Peptidiphaga gingivicola TaxID=2741497 RepID=A0A179B2U1_9ACTO|nr:xylulose kinase [Peptidiphaga gingivicola]
MRSDTMTQVYMGIDLGTGGCRVGLFDDRGRPLAFHNTPVTAIHPHPSWVEQDVDEWWRALVASTRAALARSGIDPAQIAGIGFDATSATLVALDGAGKPLRNAIMWADVRASEQAGRASEIDHWARLYNGEGKDPASAEWFVFKAMWLKENEPDVWARSAWILDAPDWMGLRLTGRPAVNLCSASLKMYHNNDHGGFPVDFYERLGVGDLMDKMPSQVNAMGEPLGTLSPEAAEELGLVAGTPVAQGGIDAEAGMIGMNVLAPGRMALITGSSNCLLAQSAIPLYGAGMFGAHTAALVRGQYTIEASQASTGSVIRWFLENSAKDLVEAAKTGGPSPYEVLNEASKDIPPGSDGVLVLEYFQGNRSPYTDAKARGTITGLTLSHRREHIYHAIQEATCYGLELNLRTMRAAGYEPRAITACGGALSSPEWLKMHADVTGLEITVTEIQDAPTLGSAMMGALAAGRFADLQEAADAMVHYSAVIKPDPARHEEYRYWVDEYAALFPAIRDIQHRTAERAEKSHKAGAEEQRDEAKARISGTVDGDTTGLADFTTMLGDGGL